MSEKIKLLILIITSVFNIAIYGDDFDKHIVVDVTEAFPSSAQLVLNENVDAGRLIRVSAGGPQFQMSVAVESVSVIDGSQLETVRKFSREEMNADWRWHMRSRYMIIVRSNVNLKKGQCLKLELTVQDQPNAAAPLSAGDQKVANCFAGLSWYLQAGVIDELLAIPFEPVTGRLFFDFIAGEPEYVEAYLKPHGRLQVVYFDKYGNPALSDGRRLKIYDGNSFVDINCNKGYDALEVNVREAAQRVRVVDSQGLEAISNARPISIDGKPIWFGEFHWHTELSSDGQRPLHDSLKSAKDQMCLDFSGSSEHIEPDGNYAYGKINQQRDIARLFEEPGRFAIISGAELSKRYGHCNFYSSNFEDFEEIATIIDESDKFANDGDDRYPHQSLAKACVDNHSLYIPHHSNMDSWVSEGVVHADGRPFWCAINFPSNPCENMLETLRLFEMCQLRGCFESEKTDSQWHVLYGGLGGSAQSALMRGYKIGFVGASDNHCGWPTRGSGGKVGITGVVSDALDNESVYENLYKRRCYAVTGQRIVADAQLNGFPVGQTVKIEPGTPRLFDIMINGTDDLDKVEIISLGLILKSFQLTDKVKDFRVQWEDDRPGRPLEDIYYYVRARQKDGSCVWLSPWWIEVE